MGSIGPVSVHPTLHRRRFKSPSTGVITVTVRDSVVLGFALPERLVSLACVALDGVAWCADSALGAGGSQLAGPIAEPSPSLMGLQLAASAVQFLFHASDGERGLFVR